ncbi:hypothetical protein CSPAE12_03640 [Colletotrichum incanum]|nr:hypothetical protein CSPAE12_03640 [Colletotrichum incanum]
MVNEILHTIDPGGDVVLVLRNPNAPFAVWKSYDWAPKSSENKEKKNDTSLFLVPDSTPEPIPEPVEDILDPDMPAPKRPSIDPGSGEHPRTVQNGNIDDGTEIKFLLSSRHLILASPYFKAKLNGTWKEATPHPFDRRYHLEASDWDPDALLILMQVIHGRMRSVPRRVDCEMLAKIAILVDYYGCHEIIEVLSTIWIDALKDQLPSECNRDLVLWLSISHVFQQDELFSRVTKTAVLESQSPIPTMDLPIRPIIIGLALTLADLIDWRRQDAIGFILNALDDLLVSLRNGSAGCSHACSCMLLGALDKIMHEQNLLGLSEPYLGYGVNATEMIVRSFGSPAWFLPYQRHPHNCTLLQLVESRLDSEFAKNKEGFSLAEAAMSDVSRRKGKIEDEDGQQGLSKGINFPAL